MIRIGRVHIPPPSARMIAVTMLALVVATLFVALRTENTRHYVERVDSACARASSNLATAADIEECDRISREAARARSLRDSCIVQRKTLKPRWYRVATRCPPMGRKGITPKVDPAGLP